MKIIIDNQSLLDFGEMMGVVFSLMNNEAGFISQNKTGCRFISKSMQITTNVWQDSEGLNLRITDLKKEGVRMSEQTDKTTREWLKEIGAESPDAELKNRIAQLEREVQEYKEENVRLLQQCLALYRAVKKANCNLDAIEESCDNNVWFQKIKERTY